MWWMQVQMPVPWVFPQVKWWSQVRWGHSKLALSEETLSRGILGNTRWWFFERLLCSPYYPGKWSNLTDMFQMGWHHQMYSITIFFDFVNNLVILSSWVIHYYPICSFIMRSIYSLYHELFILSCMIVYRRTRQSHSSMAPFWSLAAGVESPFDAGKCASHNRSQGP